MLYIAIAVVVYAFTAYELMREATPETFREAVGGALICAVVAAVWPIALVWRGLLGGGRIDAEASVPASAMTEREA